MQQALRFATTTCALTTRLERCLEQQACLETLHVADEGCKLRQVSCSRQPSCLCIVFDARDTVHVSAPVVGVVQGAARDLGAVVCRQRLHQRAPRRRQLLDRFNTEYTDETFNKGYVATAAQTSKA